MQDQPTTPDGPMPQRAAMPADAVTEPVEAAVAASGPADVRAIFSEIGNEEAVARLEARIDAFEDEIASADRRLQGHERARRGELDVLRARVEDVLGAVDAALADQRTAAQEAEARLVALLEDVRTEQQSRITALRDELTPAVSRLVRVSEGLAARIKSVEAASAGAAEAQDARHRQADAALAEVRSELSVQLADLRDSVAGVVGAVDELRDDVADRTDALAQRWVESAGDVARQVEGVLGRADERVQRERTERTQTVDHLTERLDDVVARLDTIADAALPAAERLAPSNEALRRDLDDVAARVAAQQAQLANALGTMATELASRVASMQGDLDALHEQVRGDGGPA